MSTSNSKACLGGWLKHDGPGEIGVDERDLSWETWFRVSRYRCQSKGLMQKASCLFFFFFFCWVTNHHNLNAMYYFTATIGQKSRNVPMEFLLWLLSHLGLGSSSNSLPVEGILFFALVGRRCLFLTGHQLGTALSSQKPFSSLCPQLPLSQ